MREFDPFRLASFKRVEVPTRGSKCCSIFSYNPPSPTKLFLEATWANPDLLTYFLVPFSVATVGSLVVFLFFDYDMTYRKAKNKTTV